jgi:PTH1 family peptidyl-tRNA hydrolase
MKYLIVGLGNIGAEYAHTRHNIGFEIADELVRLHKGSFAADRYADYAQISIKGKQVHVIKPNTYMNLSGKALRYWMDALKIPLEQIVVLVDDLAIDFGKIRIRKSGSDAGHNGLRNIQDLLQTNVYPRLRFGIGNNFGKGQQVAYVLGQFSAEEQKELPQHITKAVLAIEAIMQQGIDKAMNAYNK